MTLFLIGFGCGIVFILLAFFLWNQITVDLDNLIMPFETGGNQYVGKNAVHHHGHDHSEVEAH